MEKINTIMLCGIAEPWLNTLKLLKQNFEIDPVYYIAWRKDLSREELKKYFPNCFYQTIEDAWKGKGFPELKKSPLDETLLKSISHEELILLKMMDRIDPDRDAFSFSHRQYFFQDLLGIWLRIIKEYDIGLIISPSIPHRNFDYALYIASKICGIEFIMFQMTPFEDSCFLLDNIDQTPDYFKKEIKNDQKNCQIRPDIDNKIRNILLTYDKAKPSYMMKQEEISKNFPIKNNIILPFINLLSNPLQLFKEVNSYHVQKGLMPSDSKILRYQQIFKNIKWKKYKANLKKYYENLCINKINSEYVFVALHYQPEETSCPTGGRYADQLLIIELLDAYLDSNINIMVKEHKTQFYPFGEGEAGRDKYFYKRLTSISDRIKLISIYEDPFKLIDEAIATVTISGTIGWESVIRGTPAIIFGRAWYEDMPGVYKVKNYQDLISIWPDVTKDKNNISQNKIWDYHIALQNFLINAPHYKAFRGIVDRPTEENSNNLCIGIVKHLIRKGWDITIE